VNNSINTAHLDPSPDYLIMSFRPNSIATNSILRHDRMRVIDSWVQHAIYAAYCSAGRADCQKPSPRALRKLLANLRDHIKRARSSGLVSAYYLTDDYRTDLRAVLPQVRAIIRDLDPKAPTVCGFSVPLAHRYPRSRAYQNNKLARLRTALTNYSPHWCDSAALYAYSPTTTSPVTVRSDWSMRATLPIAINMLKRRGWSPTSYSLIGVPQAFGFWPRTSVRGKQLHPPQYVRAPSASQLALQIRSFCRLGAGSIVAYVWDDGSRPSDGAISNLSNSAELRRGFSQGTQSCRATFWHR